MSVWGTAPLRSAVLALPLAGCFIKPDPPSAKTDDPHDDAAVIEDGPADSRFIAIDALGDAPPACLIQDMFSSGGSCGSWAVAQTNKVIVGVGSGQLIMNGAAGGDATCTAKALTAPVDGVIVQLVSFGGGLGTNATINIVWNDGSTASIQFIGQASGSPQVLVESQGNGHVANNSVPNVQGYYWLHQTDTHLFAQYSSNGTSGWVDLESSFYLVQPHTTAQVSLSANFGSTTQIKFDNLDACP